MEFLPQPPGAMCTRQQSCLMACIQGRDIFLAWRTRVHRTDPHCCVGTKRPYAAFGSIIDPKTTVDAPQEQAERLRPCYPAYTAHCLLFSISYNKSYPINHRPTTRRLMITQLTTEIFHLRACLRGNFLTLRGPLSGNSSDAVDAADAVDTTDAVDTADNGTTDAAAVADALYLK